MKTTNRVSTEEWANSYNISTAASAPPIEDYHEPCHFSARQIAVRAIILQGFVTAACHVDPEILIEWFQEQGIWEDASPQEKAFLTNPTAFRADEWNGFRWRQEAEWTLLWMIGKVECLGLPTKKCDTRLMMEAIIPGLGTDIEPFLISAELRSPGALLAEDDRNYDLWCRYFQTLKKGERHLPHDLNIEVLYQRRYAFEWLDGVEAWDDVHCDA